MDVEGIAGIRPYQRDIPDIELNSVVQREKTPLEVKKAKTEIKVEEKAGKESPIEKKIEEKEPTLYEQVMAKKAVENANNRVRNMGTDAKFDYNDKINRVTITITDRGNNEVIKEIPSEDTQKMLERIRSMQGLFMDEGV